MYKNWNKRVAKLYLLGSVAVLCLGAVISFSLVFGLANRQGLDYSVTQRVLLSLVCSLVPLCSFAGFCSAFLRIDSLSRSQIMLMVVLCVPMVVLLVPFGLAMLLPNFIKSWIIVLNNA